VLQHSSVVNCTPQDCADKSMCEKEDGVWGAGDGMQGFWLAITAAVISSIGSGEFIICVQSTVVRAQTCAF
jgi:hypothetical protein